MPIYLEENAPGGSGTVNTGYCPCICPGIVVRVLAKYRIGSGAADAPDAEDPKTALEKAQAAWDTDTYSADFTTDPTPRAYKLGTSFREGDASESEGVSTRTDHENRNVDLDGLTSVSPLFNPEARIGSFKVKFEADLPGNWLGQTVRFCWRWKTETHTGVKTTTTVTPPSSSTYDYTDAATQEYSDEMTEEVPTVAGQTTVESSEYTIDVPEDFGVVVTVDGPARTSFLKPVLSGAVCGKTLSQIGFPAYIRVQAAPGESPGAVTLYQTETASTAPGSVTAYSGSQTLAPDDDTESPVAANTFSASVAANGPAISLPLDYYLRTDDSLSIVKNIPLRAAQVAPTEIIWGSGLKLTLSDPDSLSRIVDSVSAYLDSIDLSTDAPPGDADAHGFFSAIAGTDKAILAERFQPASELFHRARKGRYYFSITPKDALAAGDVFNVSPGIHSYWLGEPDYSGSPPVDNALSVTTTWDRTEMNLDTNVAASPTNPESEITLTGLATLYPATATDEPATVEIATLSDAYDEDAPESNARASIGNARITTETIDCLEIGPQLEVVEAEE